MTGGWFYPAISATCASDPGAILPLQRKPNMTRDELNRELRARSGNWAGLLIVYGIILGTMALSAISIV